MSKCTLIIFEMHDDISTSAASVAMKMKYTAARSTSKGMVTRTQLSSRSPMATLQTMAPTTLRAPQRSQGRSKQFSVLVVSKSLGSRPMKEG